MSKPTRLRAHATVVDKNRHLKYPHAQITTANYSSIASDSRTRGRKSLLDRP
jgi:hypothetical protein